uniref:Uncharacterized protein n=1 Tax=Physcomitrium patens TaxID=3218 RepID=A0A2K1JRC5_PHYPA|nr:hypothetical protein PHYPA_016471 [Physcomitrium patens]
MVSQYLCLPDEECLTARRHSLLDTTDQLRQTYKLYTQKEIKAHRVLIRVSVPEPVGVCV